MSGDKTRICVLFDIYGELLPPSSAGFIDLYYNDDLSLSEVAENIGISRQGVRDGIKRGVELLENYEQKLGLYDKYLKNGETLRQLRSLCEDGRMPEELSGQIRFLMDRLSI